VPRYGLANLAYGLARLYPLRMPPERAHVRALLRYVRARSYRWACYAQGFSAHGGRVRSNARTTRRVRDLPSRRLVRMGRVHLL
jgi:hypothetical protein